MGKSGQSLSHRQLIRPAHPCRINITVFAKDFEARETPGQPSTPPEVSTSRETVITDQTMPADFDIASVPPVHQAPPDGDEHPRRDTTSTASVPKNRMCAK